MTTATTTTTAAGAGTVPRFAAHAELATQARLGEGILWDDRTRLLHWVDIDRAEVHSYDPETKAHAVDAFPDAGYVSMLTPRRDAPGLVAAFEASVVTIETTVPAASGTTAPGATPRRATHTLASPLQPAHVANKLVRFNDGACDPAGRLWVGSMTLPVVQDGVPRGEMWRITPGPDGTVVADKMFDGVGTSNGIDWSPDGTTMYYIDSNLLRVECATYDVAHGTMGPRTVFAEAQPGWVGAFDGLIVDGIGNVWVARWGDSRVLVYSPQGEVLAQIDTPGARSPTIPCFGGPQLETAYIATANAELAGASQDEFPRSGDVFAVDVREGTALRALLGKEWKGRVRHRFGG